MTWMIRAAARVVLAAMLLISGVATAALAEAPTEFKPSDFGPNVLVFDPSMSTAQIQAATHTVFLTQVNNEFGLQRYQFLFMPGTYGTPAAPLNIELGYYTSVAGLGASPNDVTINGTINVLNRCLKPTVPPSNCVGLDNFWRSVENLSVKVAPHTTEFYAVSQAAPMRRVHITGDLFLFDYQTSPGFTSGGFIADTLSDGGSIINGSQQQFMTRNSQINLWTNGVWNQVFSGVQGAPEQSFPTPPYTTLSRSPVTREKPFLQLDSQGEYQVFVPAVQRNSSGTTWANGPTPGRPISIDRFFVARPTDSAARINHELGRGKNLLLTPGIYHLDRTLQINRAHTVVLGLGYPTLVPDTGRAAMAVNNTNGADVSGVMIDAGPVNSPVLLKVGVRGDRENSETGNDEDSGDTAGEPTSLHDVFFRIGGATPGRATTSLVVNSDNVILDDLWAWRADHGNGVGWDANVADTGVVINGSDVIAYGLFVEHYQKYQVVWNGERGRTIMFQNEMPYDPPNQAAWSHQGVNGWAAFKVADSVKTFEGWGMGSYAFFNVNPTVEAERAFEVPVGPGVKLHDLVTISLDGVSDIDHVVNDVGIEAAQGQPGIPVDVVSYP